MAHSTREAHLAGGVAAVAGVYDYVERPSEGSPVKGHLHVPQERHPDSPYVHQSHLTSGVAAVAGVIPLSHRPAERVRPHPQVPAERGKPKKRVVASREQATNLQVAGANEGTGLPINEIEQARPSRTAPVRRHKPMFQQPNYLVPGGAPPKAGVRPQHSQLTNDLSHVEHRRTRSAGGEDGDGSQQGRAWLDVEGALPRRAPGDWSARGTNTQHQLSTNLVPADHAGEVPLVGEHLGRGSAGGGAEINSSTAFQMGRGLDVPEDTRGGGSSKPHAQVFVQTRGKVATMEVPDDAIKHGVAGRHSELAQFMQRGSGAVVNPHSPEMAANRPRALSLGAGSGGVRRNLAVVRGGSVKARPYDGEPLANGVFQSTKNRDHFVGGATVVDEEDYFSEEDYYSTPNVGDDAAGTYAGATAIRTNRSTAGVGGSSKRTAAPKRASPRTRKAYSRRSESTGRPYEATNTILDSQNGDAPQEYATTAINRSRREHDLNETTLQGILMHVGEGLDNFISGGHVIDLDEGLPHSYIDRQTPRGQHQTTAVVGGGVVASPPRPLSAPEQAVYDATRAEAQRTGAIFDAVRAKNGSRFSPGKRRRSMGVFRRHDGAFYAGQPPSFAQSFREFQKLDRERQRREREAEREEQEAHERRCQLDIERLTTVDGRLFLFYRRHAPHLIPKIPDLLEKWRGREDTLFYRIRKKYRAPLELPEHWSRRRPGDSRSSSRRPPHTRSTRSPRARPENDEQRKAIYGTSSRYKERPYRPRTGTSDNQQQGQGQPRLVTRRTGRGERGVAVPKEEHPQPLGKSSRKNRPRHPELTPHELYTAGVEGPLTGGSSRPPTKIHLRPSGERRVIRRPPQRRSSSSSEDDAYASRRRISTGNRQQDRLNQARDAALRKRRELVQRGAQVEY